MSKGTYSYRYTGNGIKIVATRGDRGAILLEKVSPLGVTIPIATIPGGEAEATHEVLGDLLGRATVATKEVSMKSEDPVARAQLRAIQTQIALLQETVDRNSLSNQEV